MHTQNTTEKRRFHRAIYHADATLTAAGVPQSCRIIDLSLKGCLLEFSKPWSISLGIMYTLSFNLSEDTSIVMDITAVHAANNQIGFICQHIDIDSMTNLRRLVELNLGDSEMLDRELAALSDID